MLSIKVCLVPWTPLFQLSHPVLSIKLSKSKLVLSLESPSKSYPYVDKMRHVGKMRVGELRCRQSENNSSLQLSHVKNSVVAYGRMWFLYSKLRLLTQHIREFLQVTPGPFPDFLGGTWGQGYIYTRWSQGPPNTMPFKSNLCWNKSLTTQNPPLKNSTSSQQNVVTMAHYFIVH